MSKFKLEFGIHDILIVVMYFIIGAVLKNIGANDLQSAAVIFLVFIMQLITINDVKCKRKNS